MSSDESEHEAVAKGGQKKRLSVERIYQKKTQLEHILLRPDSYIGSVQPLTESMYVIEEGKVVNKDITFVPGLYKIFDEILVNAADNKQRDPKMDTIKVDIDAEKNEIKVFNNGRGIPVVQHKDEKMFVPTMIFGHLLTSSNFNDEEEKVTGGRNGFGAKLCNVFSSKFTVETASKEYKKSFKQVWGANMSKASEPKITPYSGEDYTRVTFSPDLEKFHMSSLDPNTVALLSRRAYDVAASSKGVKVFLNGKRIPIKGFKDYVDFFIKCYEEENPGASEIKPVFEACGPRWEVAVAVSENGFKQMSFVNSIATTKGGRHVDHVTDLITKALGETIKKKNKGGISIKPFQIKNHLWIFVNALIVNPTFDSQTKENMTLQVKSFGSKCVLSDKFNNLINKSGIVEAVLAWSKFKQDQMLKKNTSGKKTSKLKGIPKLEDANDAGTRNSIDCTLILTEGDSAKTLAVAGLSVVGRDKFGVYPLRGKLLNVREATHKQLLENKEINELVKIMGLTYKKKYETDDDMKSLRYGKIMIMTDQDQDGSHIKGLLINFIHHNWPTLLKRPFLEEFITPIVKASKGQSSFPFYSLPEFEEWKNSTPNWPSFKIKYYKGLGTSTSKEAKEYFSDMRRHRILFSYDGQQDDHSIQMAFSKKAVEERKEWLTNWMEDCKRRKELGMAEVYLYEKNTRSVTYSEFVNKELVLFSNLDNERSIPSLVDGLKPGQRKVVFTCLKRNDKREIKVAQLAGSVGEMSAYHHGEASLMGTIINLAQNFVGSNNVNLLLPIGQFGTRLAGGKDHASARYIFTQLNPMTRYLFHIHDDYVLKYLRDDNLRVEPEYYVPILPMVLINGADGIGTGWMTKVPNYNPKDIIKNIKSLINGGEMKEMVPWFKHFKGSIEYIGEQKYVVNGEVANLSDTKIEISELPVKTWTQTYKESVMEQMLNGSEKNPSSIISDYKEYHTDVTVKFVVTMASDKLREAERKGLHQFFKLQTTISTSSMVLFDAYGCLKKYNNPLEIISEFYDVRIRFYEKRKKYLVGMLEADNLKLKNQARFIKMKCEGSLVVENKKRKDIILDLTNKGFDSDPVKCWKKVQEIDCDTEEQTEEGDDTINVEQSDDEKKDYDYLMSMAMWSLTKERKDELLRKAQEKQDELDAVKATLEKDMWKKDLKEFENKYDELMKKEKEDLAKLYAVEKGVRKGGAKSKISTQASPHGIRIVPRIDDELRTKVAKAAAAKDRKAKKDKNPVVKDEVPDEFDDMVTGKDGNEKLVDKISKKGVVKSSSRKSDSLSSPKKGKKRENPWESDSGSGGEEDSMGESTPVKERSKRNVKVTKYSFSDVEAENSEEEEDIELFDNDAVIENNHQASSNQETLDVSDTDDDFDDAIDHSKNGNGNGNDNSEDEFDAMINNSDSRKTGAQTKKVAHVSDDSDSDQPIRKVAKKAAPKKSANSNSTKSKKAIDSDGEDDFIQSKGKKKGGPSKGSKKQQKAHHDSDDEVMDLDSSDIAPPPKSRPGRNKKKAISYNFDDSD
uniref:DNA topoisomerase 2 n=1 Tax=Lepeophtheirus salmonis TaxID=72036 RepID=A0A0K2UGB3_LEPSM